MLVFTRREGERIQIGEDITITVVRVEPFSVRLGIDAPPHVPVMRRELLERGPPEIPPHSEDVQADHLDSAEDD
jgi:carbon storage regulator